MSSLRLSILFMILLLALAGCDAPTEKSPAEPAAAAVTAPAPPALAEPAAEEEPPPPTPPVVETFDGEPQISLFPRVGGFRPEEGNSQEAGVWNAFCDHLLRTSGVTSIGGEKDGRAWSMRGIKGIDSVGFFAPLGVEPGRNYTLSFSYRGELPEGSTAGIGILEFDRFLWIGEQFTEAMAREYQTGSQAGATVKGSADWTDHTLTFTTSPRTHMIHLVLFREGASDRQPIYFDNIAIAAADEKPGPEGH